MNRKTRLDDMAAAMRAKQPRRCVPWTEEQIDYVRRHAASTPRAEMCAHLDRAPRTLSKLLRKLGMNGLRKPAPWSDRETEILRSLAPTQYIHSISVTLKRDPRTVKKEAARLGIELRDWKKSCAATREDYERMVADGLTVRQIAERRGCAYNAALQMLDQLGLKATPDPRGHAWRAPGSPKPPKSAKPVRERVGLPVVARRVIHGSVAICDRCYAPVVNTPERWAEHKQRVHTAPVFAIPCSTRRIA